MGELNWRKSAKETYLFLAKLAESKSWIFWPTINRSGRTPLTVTSHKLNSFWAKTCCLQKQEVIVIKINRVKSAIEIDNLLKINNVKKIK